MSHDLEIVGDNNLRQPHHPRDTVAAEPRMVKDAGVSVSVVMPTMNEGRNIGWVLERMPPVDELIVVDGCSTDRTVEEVLKFRPDATVITQAPTGKGAAMRTGFAAATGEVIIAIDADGSMDPQEIPMFVALFGQGFEVVKGSRSMCGGGSTDLTRLRSAGNRSLVAVYNSLFGGENVSDLCYGYIGFRRRCLKSLGLYADGFEIESQILCHAQLAGLSIAELPSQESNRRTGESNLRTFRDGSRVLRAMLRSRLTPGREHWRAMGAASRGSSEEAGISSEETRHVIREARRLTLNG